MNLKWHWGLWLSFLFARFKTLLNQTLLAPEMVEELDLERSSSLRYT